MWEEPWDQKQKGFLSHMVLGKSLPFWASVSLSEKTTQCQLHLQGRCANEQETFKSTNCDQSAKQTEHMVKTKDLYCQLP